MVTDQIQWVTIGHWVKRANRLDTRDQGNRLGTWVMVTDWIQS